MKRRHFLISSLIALGMKPKFSSSEVSKDSGQTILKKSKFKMSKGELESDNNNIKLPKNPKPFEEAYIIEVTYANRIFPPKLISKDEKIMNFRSNFKLRFAGTYVIQYSGPDIGWMVM